MGYPRDFNIYWGYTSLFNLLDYPSVILSISELKMDPKLGRMDDNYQPLETNP